MKNSCDLYIKKRISKTAPYFEHIPQTNAQIAIAIPALNEAEHLIFTLDSLLHAHKDESAVIIITVNNKKTHNTAIKQNNQRTLDFLYAEQHKFANALLPLIIIDCCSSGREIPEQEGVGFARKIALDYAFCSGCQILACMDSDTLVAQNYFTELEKLLPFCNANKNFCGVTDFFHQKAENPQLQKYSNLYETYLKNHSLFLQKTGTPYYPVALGPTIVCSRFSYATSGGMPQKIVTEDFYFLQNLIKTTPDFKVTHIPTVVYPASRVSERVPFGTGAALRDCINGEKKISEFPQSYYDILKTGLHALDLCMRQIDRNADSKNNENILNTQNMPQQFGDFLQKEGFTEVWKKLLQNNKNYSRLKAAFFIWFDGLKIIKLFHFLRDS